MINVLAPAKINLFLKVIDRRPDGYHLLETLLCRVGIYDTVTIDPKWEGISISCPSSTVPEDHTNLAYRAASLFSDALKKKTSLAFKGARIKLKKTIPAGAGLGGGSSDAASVLMALNRVYNRPFTTRQLMKIGLEIGADVPFFIFKKPAIATGIGEKLRHFTELPSHTALIVYPGFDVSTGTVYKNLNLRLTKDKKKLSKFDFDGKNLDIKRHLINDLESVTIPEHPVISDIKKTLLLNGAIGSLMSGSGSAVFGLFKDRKQADVARMSLLNIQQNTSWLVFVADLLV